MVSDLISFFIQTLVIDPLSAELEARLSQAQAPVAVISQAKTCVADAVPALSARIGDDPLQGISLALDVWLERAKVEDIVLEAAPACRPIVEAARPYLQRQAV